VRRLRAQLADAPLLRHVGIIMDGNRRWARERGMANPSLGHKFGAEHIEKVLGWCEKTGTGRHLTLAVGYGGRQEVTDAFRSLLYEHAEKGTTLAGLAETITADDIARHLYTAGQPDPDLVIRTSGEQRLSNFLLWQSAYSETVLLRSVLARLPGNRLPPRPAQLRRQATPLRQLTETAQPEGTYPGNRTCPFPCGTCTAAATDSIRDGVRQDSA
jgi:undecaprenyl pyrophosphate synthase